MTLAEHKVVEEKIKKLVEDLTIAEKAVLCKTLHAEGLRITACDVLIRRKHALVYTETQKATPTLGSYGMPLIRFPLVVNHLY